MRREPTQCPVRGPPLTAFSTSTEDKNSLPAHRMRAGIETLPSPAVSKRRSRGSRSALTKPCWTPPKPLTTCGEASTYSTIWPIRLHAVWRVGAILTTCGPSKAHDGTQRCCVAHACTLPLLHCLSPLYGKKPTAHLPKISMTHAISPAAIHAKEGLLRRVARKLRQS